MFETGHFSQLWCQVAEKFGIQIEYVPGNWRRGVAAADVAVRLVADERHSLKAVMVVHNETSTGVTSCIPEIRRAMDQARHPALLMVDTISSLGSIDYRHDEWEIDVTVSGSQKGLMMPPGLSFNAISEKALAANKSAKLPRSYWNWQDMLAPNRAGFFPYTQLQLCSTVCGKRSRCCRKRGFSTCFSDMIVTRRPLVLPCERGVWKLFVKTLGSIQAR
jgi:alanine-glyoxylate transaminase / serine-glyoxylate transaminase / serine-pyruvate transaminase